VALKIVVIGFKECQNATITPRQLALLQLLLQQLPCQTQLDPKPKATSLERGKN